MHQLPGRSSCSRLKACSVYAWDWPQTHRCHHLLIVDPYLRNLTNQFLHHMQWFCYCQSVKLC